MFHAIKFRLTHLPAFLVAMFIFVQLPIISVEAQALTVSQAKQQGLVGETPTGYLAIVKSSPEVVALVNEVNAKRKIEYQNVARKNGTPLKEVEKLGAIKAIEVSAAGTMIQLPDGKWIKK